jgi:hypothetical protein
MIFIEVGEAIRSRELSTIVIASSMKKRSSKICQRLMLLLKLAYEILVLRGSLGSSHCSVQRLHTRT